MADVFLSYKSEDRSLVEALARALEREGFRVWWDRKINAGGGWRETILSELRAAKVVVVAWSRRTEDVSAASGMLNEVDEAARLGLPIIPVMLEGCEPPFGYRHVQAADLSDWRGDARHAEWREVLDGVRAAVTGRRIGRVTPMQAGQTASRRRGASASSMLLSVALLAAAFVGWRYIGALEAAPAPQRPVVEQPTARLSPPVVEPETAQPRWRDRREAAADGVVRRVAFVGAGGVRGMFRRTDVGDWVERNSEIGLAGAYHVNSENAEVILLHDGNRDVHARIDLARGVIAIRDPGARHYQDRYRIVSVNGAERGTEVAAAD